jgi:hypothetical protein
MLRAERHAHRDDAVAAISSEGRISRGERCLR